MPDDASLTFQSGGTKAQPPTRTAPKIPTDVLEGIRSKVAAGTVTPELQQVINEMIDAGDVDPRDLMAGQEDTQAGMASTDFLSGVLREGAAGALESAGGAVNFATDPFGTAEQARQGMTPEGVQQAQAAGVATPTTSLPGDPLINAAQAIQPDRSQFTTDADVGLAAAREVGRSVPFSGGGVAAAKIGTKGLPALDAVTKAERIRQMTGLQRIMLDVARNPRKAIALESAIAGGAGASGELVAQNLGEDYRVFGELTAALGAPVMAKVLLRMQEAVAAKFGGVLGSNPDTARRMVGEILLDVLPSIDDPAAQQKIKQFLALQRNVELDISDSLRPGRGMGLPLAQVVDRPDISRIANEVGVPVERIRDGIRADIQAFGQSLRQAQGTQSLEQFEQLLETKTAEMLNRYDAEMQHITENLVNSAMRAATPTERAALSEQGFELFQQKRTEAKEYVEQIYNPIKNVAVPSRLFKFIQNAKTQATATTLAKKSNIDPVVRNLAEEAKATFQGEVSLQTLRDYDSLLSQRLREARAVDAPNRDTIQRIGFLKSAIHRVFDELENVPGLTAEQITTLRQANNARKEFAKIFEDFEAKKVMALTGQSQFRESAEDFLSNFIVSSAPGSPKPKDVFAKAERFRQITGNSPEAKNLIRQELMDRAYAFAYDEYNKVFKPERFRMFTKRHEATIEAHGLRKEFADVVRRVDDLEARQSDLMAVRDRFNTKALKSLLNSKDIEKAVESALNSPKQLAQITRDLSSFRGSGVERAWKEAVADTILNRAIQTDSIDLTHQFDPRFLSRVLSANKENLRKILGEQHVKRLEGIARFIQLAERNPSTAGGTLPENLADRAFPTMQLMFSRIAQAQLRIMSPRFAVTDLTLRTLQAKHSQVMRQIMREVLSDTQKAEELMRLTRNELAAPSLRSLLSGNVLNVVLRPASQGVIQGAPAEQRGRARKELTMDQVLRGK